MHLLVGFILQPGVEWSRFGHEICPARPKVYKQFGGEPGEERVARGCVSSAGAALRAC